MGESFQILRGSSIRSASRRVCSSTLTLSQYLIRMIPLSTIAFSTAGTCSRNLVALLRGAVAHDRLDAGAVVPAAVEDGDLAGRREVGDVALDVHLRLLALGRRRQGDVLEHPRARPLGDPPDRAALARRVQALEHDADLRPGGLHPLLHGHQLTLQDRASRARSPSSSSSTAARRGLDRGLGGGRRNVRGRLLLGLVLLRHGGDSVVEVRAGVALHDRITRQHLEVLLRRGSQTAQQDDRPGLDCQGVA